MAAKKPAAPISVDIWKNDKNDIFEKIWKDGNVSSKNGCIQRYICSECEYRFRGEKILSVKKQGDTCRVCDIVKESKNLTVVSNV